VVYIGRPLHWTSRRKVLEFRPRQAIVTSLRARPFARFLTTPCISIYLHPGPPVNCSHGRRFTLFTCCHLTRCTGDSLRSSFLVSCFYLVCPRFLLTFPEYRQLATPSPRCLLCTSNLRVDPASCTCLLFVRAMNAFSYPPPPPPPPPAAGAPPPPSHSRGGYGNNRGGRGRGRGNNRGGGHRGGFSHSPGAAAYGQNGIQNPPPPSNGYPLPSYPQWQQAAGNPQVTYQAPHVQPPSAQYSAQSYGYAQTPPMPQSSVSMPPSYSVQSSYYGHGLQTASNPSLPTQAPLMGPPIRWGFDRAQSAGRGTFKVQNHSSPNPFPDGGTKRKRDHTSQGPHLSQPTTGDTSVPQQKPHSLPKVQVAPAVPTFGFSLPPKPPPLAGAPSEKSRKKRKRKQNQLGLTPKGEIHEDTDEDIDEEAAFVQSGQPSVAMIRIKAYIC
jgi:hypothetical protein